jgi:hypothetical protein
MPTPAIGAIMTTGRTRAEEFKVSGRQLLETVKRVVREGNVRRIVLRNTAGRTVLDLPLTAGIVGAALVPLYAAVAGLAALAAHYTLVVERSDDPPRHGPPAVH